MWSYEKHLQYPVKVKCTSLPNARAIISQLGGPDGEIGASMRYLNQRYTMTDNRVAGLLTDIGTEELGHMEIVSALLRQLTRDATVEEIKASGFDAYFVDHTIGVYPQSSAGVPFSAATLQCTGDPVTDLFENMAAEQKARTTYDNILLLVDDADVRDAIKFLRAREIVHFQRFGEGLRIVTDKLDSKNFYAINPAFN